MSGNPSVGPGYSRQPWLPGSSQMALEWLLHLQRTQGTVLQNSIHRLQDKDF